MSFQDPHYIDLCKNSLYWLLLIICRPIVSGLKHLNWYVGIPAQSRGLFQCSHSHVTGTMYNCHMWLFVYPVGHYSPLYYASESLVIHAENINSPLKPTVRSEFTSVQSLVKIALLWHQCSKHQHVFYTSASGRLNLSKWLSEHLSEVISWWSIEVRVKARSYGNFLVNTECWTDLQMVHSIWIVTIISGMCCLS